MWTELDLYTSTMNVPGGMIYRYIGSGGVAMCFVPFVSQFPQPLPFTFTNETQIR